MHTHWGLSGGSSRAGYWPGLQKGAPMKAGTEQALGFPLVALWGLVGLAPCLHASCFLLLSWRRLWVWLFWPAAEGCADAAVWGVRVVGSPLTEHGDFDESQPAL